MNPAAVDPKTASLADALTDWIALLEKDDSKTATARWATNAAVGKVTAEWKALRECHKQHDYRRWIENSSDEPTTGLIPGGARRIGKDTTFRVGGHGFGHLHIMWEKTHSGWRIASTRWRSGRRITTRSAAWRITNILFALRFITVDLSLSISCGPLCATSHFAPARCPPMTRHLWRNPPYPSIL